MSVTLKQKIEQQRQAHFNAAMHLALNRPNPLDIPRCMSDYQTLADHLVAVGQFTELLIEPPTDTVEQPKPRPRARRQKAEVPQLPAPGSSE